VDSGSLRAKNGFGEAVKGDGAAGIAEVAGIEDANGFEGGGEGTLDG
jgi:hypothetical protein